MRERERVSTERDEYTERVSTHIEYRQYSTQREREREKHVFI